MDLSRIINPPEDPPSPRLPTLIPSSPPEPASPVAETEDDLDEENEETPALSFIVAMEASEEGKVCYLSPTALELMGWDPEEVIGTPASLYCHPDDAADLYRAYQEMISEDKAACLMYHRIPYKDPRKGHLLCSVTISRVGPHLIGACSPATSATKAMHNASTAQEIIVITPSAARLAFRRWNVSAPSAPPMSASSSSSGPTSSSRDTTPPTQAGASDPDSSPKNEPDDLTQSLRRLTLSPPSHPEVAKRVAFVLNRFSKNVPVIYSTNDDILPRSVVVGRPFYDFITPADETRVRQAMDAVKGWGVTERGDPSDGGFAFNRFHMYLRGRDSTARPDTDALRKRRSLHAVAPVTPAELSASTVNRNRSKQRIPSERGVNAPTRDTLLVDSIFSPQSDGIIVVIRPALQTGV